MSFLDDITNTKSEVQSADTAGRSKGFMERLSETPPEQRKPVVVAHLTTLAEMVLNLQPGTLTHPSKNLTTLGMDSLIAMDFRSRIKKDLGSELGRAVPAAALFSDPSVEGLASFLLSEVITNERVPFSAKTQIIASDATNSDARWIKELIAAGLQITLTQSVADAFRSRTGVDVPAPYLDRPIKLEALLRALEDSSQNTERLKISSK